MSGCLAMRWLVILCFFFSCGVMANTDRSSASPSEISAVAPDSEPVNRHNWRAAVADVRRPAGVLELPAPQALPHPILHLTLKEAILLSLRNNPNIQSADLGRVMDKFALLVAHNAYEPQFTLGGQSNFAQGSNPVYTGNAGVNLNTPLGTQLGVNYNNTLTGGGGPAVTNFSVTQPLLQGFGAKVNLIPWLNALDSENSARLNFKGTMMAQVVAIVTNYYQLIQDDQNLEIQRRTLESNARTVKESELRLKVGQLARSDWMQQKATYETTKLSMLSQKSAWISDYQTFLAALGLKASAHVEIDRKIDFTKMKIPHLSDAIHLALKGNVVYQQQLIAIRATKRAVLSAKNAARWQLNLTGNFSVSGGQTSVPQFINTTGGATSSPFIAQNSPSLIASLSIPIHNVQQQQAVVNASVQLEQARLALENARLTLARQITNEVQQIHNQRLTVKAAEQQVKFQRESLLAAQIKYRHGRTTVFEVNQIQDQLLAQEIALVSNRVTLLNQMTALNQTLGLTLQQWGIRLRY